MVGLELCKGATHNQAISDGLKYGPDVILQMAKMFLQPGAKLFCWRRNTEYLPSDGSIVPRLIYLLNGSKRLFPHAGLRTPEGLI